MSESTLYKQKDQKPFMEVNLIPDEEENVMGSFFTDEEDTKLLGFISKRFTDMENARPDDDWEIRQQQFTALTLWNDDGTAETNMPIEMATIRNKMADALSQKPNITFIPVEPDDVDKVSMTRELWDFVWREGDTDKELFDLFLMSYIFGTAFWFEGLHKEITTRFEVKQTKGEEITSVPKTITKSWLKGFALDIRDVYIDPVHDLDVAVDCFLLERDISRDRLTNLKNDPNYKNIDEALSLGEGESNDKRIFLLSEEEKKRDDLNKFTFYHYYNKEKGKYIVTVNNVVIIRDGVLPYAHGDLPISALIDHKNPREIYGRGECELLESTKYERNEIRNQIIDLVRRSNDTKLAMGQGISLEDSGYIDDVTQVFNFDGDLSQFQYLKQPSQDSGLFNVEELLRNDATWITGIDNNSLAGAPQKTAFEARLQEQTKLKGISISLKLADFFYTRMARQRLSNIQFWLPTTTGRTIIGNRKFREIAIPDKELVPVKSFLKDELKETGVKFENKKGATAFFELKPSVINSSLDIEVQTPSTTPLLKDLNRLELQEVFNQVLAAGQVDPAIIEKFDTEGYVKEQIRMIGQDPEDFFEGEDEEKATQDLRESILGDLPLPPKTSTQPQRQDMNPVLQGQMQEQPPVTQ